MGYRMKKLMLVILSVIAIISIQGSKIPIQAASTDYYVEVAAPDGGVNMRQGPGVEYEKVRAMIPNGEILHIVSEETTSNGNNWGYTEFEGTAGWVALTQVRVTDYEEYENTSDVYTEDYLNESSVDVYAENYLNENGNETDTEPFSEEVSDNEDFSDPAEAISKIEEAFQQYDEMKSNFEDTEIEKEPAMLGKMSTTIMVIMIFVVTVLLNRVYNRIFTVVHFGFQSIAKEWFVCFCFACIIVSVAAKVFGIL